MTEPSCTPCGITTPKGFRACAGAVGIKASGKPDLVLIVADTLCVAAGVFTTNQMKSAPVLVDLDHLKTSRGRAQAIVCNSGNANASTGLAGQRDAVEMCRMVAEKTGCQTNQVLVCSTGIIGRPMPMEKVAAGVAKLYPTLGSGWQADAAAAQGIMTTDLVPKVASQTIRIGGKKVTFSGICKGSGMIAPNLGTMLVFLTTDAAVTSAMLHAALKDAVVDSFNRISVDQHTSPSDTVLALASGLAGNAPIAKKDLSYVALVKALTALCKDLAYQIVKDGEGATRVYRVRVFRARSIADADKVGRAVVDSPLVKCAIHGADPNWGRITTAAGYSGAEIVPERMSLYIGPKKDICVFKNGQPTTMGQSPTPELAAMMKEKEIVLTIDLGLGKMPVIEWLGCDLSREYIRINADYTT